VLAINSKKYPQDTKTTGTVSNRKQRTGSLLLWKIRTGMMRQFLAGKMGWKDRHHYQISARQKRRWRQEFSKATFYTGEGLINSSFVIPVEAGSQ
jgi:hypothetical protein